MEGWMEECSCLMTALLGSSASTILIWMGGWMDWWVTEFFHFSKVYFIFQNIQEIAAMPPHWEYNLCRKFTILYLQKIYVSISSNSWNIYQLSTGISSSVFHYGYYLAAESCTLFNFYTNSNCRFPVVLQTPRFCSIMNDVSASKCYFINYKNVFSHNLM